MRGASVWGRAGGAGAILRLLAPLALLGATLAVAPAPPSPARATTAEVPRLLVVEQVPRTYQYGAGQGWIERVRPIDPDTLADLPGRDPLDLGAYVTMAASPDGRTLAAFVADALPGAGPDERAGPATLHLVDLVAWRDAALDVRADGWIDRLRFAPDGRSLAWLAHPGPPSGHGAPLDETLYRYDLVHRTVLPPLRLPFPLVDGPGVSVQPLPGGRLALYGVPADEAGRPAGAPHLLLLDLAAGRVRADLRLDGVRDGRFARADGVDEVSIPGVAWDPPRGRLYLAHADADRITVVDLARGAIVAQADITGWSGPDVSLDTPAGPRDTPVGPVTVRAAAVSVGGARLFIQGARTERVDLPDGGRAERHTDLGLRAIDTGTLRETGRLDLAGGATVSPDGERLLVRTAHYDNGHPSPDPAAFQLAVFDARRLVELRHLDVTPGDTWPGFFSPDGRRVYLLRPSGGHLARRPDDPAAIAGGPVLAIFDLETGRVVAERAYDYFPRPIPTWIGR